MDSFQHLPLLAVGLGKVRLYVPMAVQEGDTAVLRCLFDLGGDALYSVKWYKGGREIFRYLPRETPSIKIFPIPYLIDLNIEGIKRLYPQHFDRRRELRKLNHSLLVNFLDLLDLLVRCPESPRRAEKVEDLSLLFIHIHHLLNEFRPHQARETLRVMMDLQRRQRIEISQRFQKHLDKVMEMLQQALHTLPDTSDLDSKLIVPTEAFESMETSDPNFNEMDTNKTKSNATHLVLTKVTTNLSGRYSCEVSADAPSFRTALVTGDMNIVVPPTILPRVEGMKPRYRVGDILKATCTSKNSKPAANLTWGLNGNILDSEYIKKFSVKIEPETNLETATSTLSLELQRHHFSASGRLKLKCTASIHNIYWRTSENSAEEERPKAAVVAAQDYRLHDVFRKPIDLYYTTPVPSNCAASMKLYIVSVSGISKYLIKNAIFLSLFLFNYCYFY